MKNRRIVALAVAAIIFAFAQSTPIYALPSDPIVPTGVEESISAHRWQSTNIVIPSIYNSGRKIFASLFISPKDNTTTTQGTLYLEMKVGGRWEEAKSWTIDEVGKVNVTKTYRGNVGITYRTRVVVRTGLDNIDVASSEVTL